MVKNNRNYFIFWSLIIAMFAVLSVLALFWNEYIWMQRTSKLTSVLLTVATGLLCLPYVTVRQIKKQANKEIKIKLVSTTKRLYSFHTPLGILYFLLIALHCIQTIRLALFENGSLFNFAFLSGWVAIFLFFYSYIYGAILKRNILKFRPQHSKSAILMFVVGIIHIVAILGFVFIQNMIT